MAEDQEFFNWMAAMVEDPEWYNPQIRFLINRDLSKMEIGVGPSFIQRSNLVFENERVPMVGMARIDGLVFDSSSAISTNKIFYYS